MPVLERRDPRHQPAHGESGGHGDLNGARGVRVCQSLNTFANGGKTRRQVAGQRRSLRGERDPASVPGNEGHTQPGLQSLDLLADRRVADIQCRAGPRIAPGLGHGSEGPEAVERRKIGPGQLSEFLTCRLDF